MQCPGIWLNNFWYVYEGNELAVFKAVDWAKQIALPLWVGISALTEKHIRAQNVEKENSRFLCLTALVGTWVLSCPHHGTNIWEHLDLAFLGLPAYGQHIPRLLNSLYLLTYICTQIYATYTLHMHTVLFLWRASIQFPLTIFWLPMLALKIVLCHLCTKLTNPGRAGMTFPFLGNLWVMRFTEVPDPLPTRPSYQDYLQGQLNLNECPKCWIPALRVHFWIDISGNEFSIKEEKEESREGGRRKKRRTNMYINTNFAFYACWYYKGFVFTMPKG